MNFDELSAKPDAAGMQEEVLAFWKEENVFEKSVQKETKKESANILKTAADTKIRSTSLCEKNEVIFYDGPPFPTGKPHHGTVLVSFIKDMIARYQTMRGYSVPRVWGWDCHGLPIENQAETLMGITDKNEIERSIGIDKFNEKCFEIVSTNNETWKEYVEQMARWVDYDGAYKTMDVTFMESVMWAFKKCYDKGLIYRDYRVTPYCMHCETSLSISDTRESDSTRMRQDRWIMTKFKTEQAVNGKPVFLLAWTTTPWTLPSNLCLAVGEQLDYAFVEMEQEIFVACKNTLPNFPKVFGETPAIVKECKGEELVGLSYEPLFDYFAEKRAEGAFVVVAADYVGAEEGVGIVHTAPAYGEDDYWTGKKNGIPLVNPVDEKGHFTQEVTDFYDDKQEKNVIDMNPAVIRFLYEKGKAVADGTIEHNYPHCWRCKRPLIYKAMDAWYFRIDKIKSRLLEENEEINWIPETVKHGRFGNWLENARDWNISRNRYWSTPIPIWECEECKERKVLGSIEEIYKESGVKLTNLHRQHMDKVTLTCKYCGKTMRRVPEVLDCWFESGSVPFAQKHYPFENKEWFESHFPSDFIVEYTGQIRCWFYYLHVLAVALFDKKAFKNCIVHGTILAKDGKKLSKSSKNYTDPMQLMKQYGTDAFRLYLYQSNAMLLGDLLFDDSGIQDAYQQILLPFWNACNFFLSYANIDGFTQEDVLTKEAALLAGEPGCIIQSESLLDQWLLAKLYETEQHIKKNLDAYQVNHYIEYIVSLLDGLTNWYIRRSRRRFWSSKMTKDKTGAYQTLYYVLVSITKLLAPAAPILSEKLYKTLTSGYSVHLTSWLVVPDAYKNEELLAKVEMVREVIYLARSIRNKNKIKNRQPLQTLRIALYDSSKLSVVREFMDTILEELNVKQVEIVAKVESLAEITYAPDFNVIREKYPDRVPALIKAIKSKSFVLEHEEVILTFDDEEGRKERFLTDILFVSYKARDGQHVASSSKIVVSLDLTITEELKQEGFTRDIVRNVQEARKQLGCAITDSILLDMERELPDVQKSYIAKETLGSFEKISDPDRIITIEEDDDKELIIRIKRVSSYNN